MVTSTTGNEPPHPDKPVKQIGLLQICYLSWVWCFRSRRAILFEFYHPTTNDQQRQKENPSRGLDEWRADYLAQYPRTASMEQALRDRERQAVVISRLNGLWFLFWSNLAPLLLVSLLFWAGVVRQLKPDVPITILGLLGVSLLWGVMLWGMVLLTIILGGFLTKGYLRFCSRLFKIPFDEGNDTPTTTPPNETP